MNMTLDGKNVTMIMFRLNLDLSLYMQLQSYYPSLIGQCNILDPLKRVDYQYSLNRLPLWNIVISKHIY